MNFEPQRGEVVFEFTRLKNSNKKGIIRSDNNGGYSMCIGGLNAFNSVGEYYTYEGAEKFFRDNSTLQRKISRGVLRAEYGHPTMEEVFPQVNFTNIASRELQGMIQKLFYERVLKVEPTKVCGTWVRIWLSKESLTDNEGRKIIPIMGTIRPSGPYGNTLKQQFETNAENVCFSIRSFAQKTLSPQGFFKKRIDHIVTWDYVLEPGIYNAEKLISPTLESYSDKDVKLISSQQITYNVDTLLSGLDEIKVKDFSVESDFNYLQEFKNTLIKIKRDVSINKSHLNQLVNSRDRARCLSW